MTYKFTLNYTYTESDQVTFDKTAFLAYRTKPLHGDFSVRKVILNLTQ